MRDVEVSASNTVDEVLINAIAAMSFADRSLTVCDITSANGREEITNPSTPSTLTAATATST